MGDRAAKKTGDFVVNEKDKLVNLTEEGVKKVEKFFQIENLADPENLEIQHNIILALRAHNLMFRDQDYVVKDDQVLIVDEFTGRIMPGRRYLRWSASGDRGKGTCKDQERKQDTGNHYLPEFLQ